MRLGSAYESVRSQLQQSQQDAADLHIKNVHLQAELSAARETIARMHGAIEWALGYTDFAPRAEGQGAYWWRKELRARSGFTFQQDKGEGKDV